MFVVQEYWFEPMESLNYYIDAIKLMWVLWVYAQATKKKKKISINHRHIVKDLKNDNIWYLNNKKEAYISWFFCKNILNNVLKNANTDLNIREKISGPFMR